MPISRRDFLTASAALACSTGTSAFWKNVALAAPGSDQPGAAETVLVVIELTGGNDGLNTVIPHGDPAYAAARPKLKPAGNKIIRISDSLAFHPALGGLAKLLERSQLAILQGVGYPNPNRSHFSSMDIWHTAMLKPEEAYGWLGKGIEKLGSAVNGIAVGGDTTPRALAGPTSRAVTLRSLADYDLQVAGSSNGERRRRVIQDFAAQESPDSGDLADLVRQSSRETYRSIARLRQIAARYDTPVKYPATGLAGRLKLVAQLVAAGVPDRVYYTSLGGFDTHSNQGEQHHNLLAELSGAIEAFQADMSHHGQQKRVLTITFSEFGRRVRENASIGTDHGAASQMFAVGEAVNAGPLGDHPSLTDLDDGDLKFHTDFRRVYATILDQWLKVPSAEILGSEFKPIELFKTTSPS